MFKQFSGSRLNRIIKLLLVTSIVVFSFSQFHYHALADSQTIVSLSPDYQETVLIPSEQGQTRIRVDINVNNVVNLKYFELSIVADGDILESIHGEFHGDPSSWCGGGRSSGGSGYGSYTVDLYTLSNSISGSGVLLSYWFIPKGAGVTDIKLRDVIFRDSSDNLIPVTVQDNSSVKVASFPEYVDGQYEILSIQNETLQNENKTLTTEYNQISSDYSSLQSDYGDLNNDYISLQSDYESLNSSYNSLETEHEAIIEELASVTSENDKLTNDIKKFNEDLDTAKDKVSSMQNANYILIGATAVLFIITTFLIVLNIRNRKA